MAVTLCTLLVQLTVGVVATVKKQLSQMVTTKTG